MEELEETAAEQNIMAAYWDELKSRVFSDDTEGLEEVLKGMHKTAVATACEAVQTAAMALKMLDYHGTQMDCPAKEALNES